jgi:hypothetical protein
MKRFIIILALVLFLASPAIGKEYTSTVGNNWLITGADLSNCTGLTGNTWIETLVRLPGSLFYVDSGATGAGTGLSWTDAVTTGNAAVALCTADSGDVINFAPQHTETLGAGADGLDIDVAGITLVGWGVGENRPTFDYDTATDEVVIGADDVTLVNFNFKANVTDVAKAVDVEAGSENFTIQDSRFYVETTGTDEFTDAIIGNAGCDNGKIINCDIEMGAGGAASAINTAGTDYLLVKNCRINGDYSVANIEDATTASIWITIQDNLLVNGTVGGAAGLNAKPVITLKSDTAALIVNNECVANVATSDLAIVAADGFLSGNTYNETEGGLANAPPVGLIAGQTYTAQIADVAVGDEDLFLVAGGEILITAFVGEVTTVFATSAATSKIWMDATDAALDYDFTTAVDLTDAVDGGRFIMSVANPSVLTPLALGATGSGSLMGQWYCVPGMIEVVDSDDNDSTGATTWTMTFIPLVEGVTVTPQ